MDSCMRLKPRFIVRKQKIRIASSKLAYVDRSLGTRRQVQYMKDWCFVWESMYFWAVSETTGRNLEFLRFLALYIR